MGVRKTILVNQVFKKARDIYIYIYIYINKVICVGGSKRKRVLYFHKVARWKIKHNVEYIEIAMWNI